MSEKEYIEQLHFCEKHKLICFEFYRRNKDWRRKKGRADEKCCGGLGNVKTN